jgi:tetratricopeptide (TPR) repeat protein
VTESLINSLSQLPNVKVVARSSAFHYKGRELDVQKIAAELNVQAVMIGRIVQRGDTLDINVDLIDVANNAQMWGQHYIRKVSDILRVQDDIAQKVTDTLRVRLTGPQQAQVTKRSTENPEAYQLYLKGRYHFNKQNEEGFRTSLPYFQQAIEVDPNYARAYAGIADDYCFAADFYLSNTEAYTKARAAATRALEIDESLAEGHAAMGTVNMFYDWNWSESEKEFKRSVELDPNYALTYEIYSLLLGLRGHQAEGIAMAKQAQQLDPLSLYANAAVADALIRAGQYDQAAEQLHKVFDLDRNWWWSHLWAAEIYERKKQFREAVAETETARQSEDNPLVIGKLGRAYALSGNLAEAKKLMDELKDLSKRTYVPSSLIAEIYAAIGDRDHALEWLDKAYDERDAGTLFLKTDPIWDGVRSDPRFTTLVKGVGL